MLYRNIVIIVSTYPLFAAEIPTTPISLYKSAVPSLEVPPLKVLAAQKVHELSRQGKLMHPHIMFASSSRQQSSSPEETICNELLQGNFPQMKKENAEQYALDLAGGRVALSDSGGRVKQKILAIEMRCKIDR